MTTLSGPFLSKIFFQSRCYIVCLTPSCILFKLTCHPKNSQSEADNDSHRGKKCECFITLNKQVQLPHHSCILSYGSKTGDKCVNVGNKFRKVLIAIRTLNGHGLECNSLQSTRDILIRPALTWANKFTINCILDDRIDIGSVNRLFKG